MAPLPVSQRVLSVLTAFCCFLVSTMALFVALNALDCVRHDMIGSDPECPAQFGWAMLIMNPFALLTIFFLLALGVVAVRTNGSVARRVLAWWAVLFTGMLIVVSVL